MPAAVWAPAAIAAVGSLGAGIIGSRSASNATKAQSQANAAALQFERQKYYDEQAQARAQWEAQEARRAPYRAVVDAMLRGHARRAGITLPEGPTSSGGGFPGVSAMAPATGSTDATAAVQPTRMNLASLAGMGRQPRRDPLTPALEAPGIMTLADLARR